MRRRRAGERARIAAFLPMAALLESRGDLGRHVFLVMLGEDRAGDENAVRHPPFGDYALPLTKQVRDDAVIANRDIGLAIGHAKRDPPPILVFDALRLDQPADADTP